MKNVIYIFNVYYYYYYIDYESDSNIKYRLTESNIIGLHMIPTKKDINSDNTIIKLKQKKSLKKYLYYINY